MPFSMSQASLPVFEIGLNALSGVLDKAAAHAAAKKVDPAVLLGWRLAPDMFALTRQVQIATDMVKAAAARLSGTEIPKYEDNETTIAQMKARIASVLAFANSIDVAKFTGSEDRDIVVPQRSGDRRFKGLNYLRDYVLPNLYFHVTMTYAILRHNGVELGKNDFIGAQ